MVREVFSNGAIEIASLDGCNAFKINRPRLKVYYVDEDHIKVSMDLSKTPSFTFS